MKREVAEKIVKGITDKIECNTADIDDWAEFWGFTREEYEEFLDMAVKALEQTSPCDLCQYNPPSSGDGKPCIMCPACSGGDEE